MVSPVIIGGSAGSFPILFKIIDALQDGFDFPIIICVHRLRSGPHIPLFWSESPHPFPIIEPESNIKLENGSTYIAPPNKHLGFLDKQSLVLTDDPPVKYSRPSIDYTMISAAKIFKKNLMGILLTGANKDGAEGLKSIHDQGGITIVQDPKNAEFSVMPQSAMDLFNPSYILSAEKIIKFIEKLTVS